MRHLWRPFHAKFIRQIELDQDRHARPSSSCATAVTGYSMCNPSWAQKSLRPTEDAARLDLQCTIQTVSVSNLIKNINLFSLSHCNKKRESQQFLFAQKSITANMR